MKVCSNLDVPRTVLLICWRHSLVTALRGHWWSFIYLGCKTSGTYTTQTYMDIIPATWSWYSVFCSLPSLTGIGWNSPCTVRSFLDPMSVTSISFFNQAMTGRVCVMCWHLALYHLTSSTCHPCCISHWDGSDGWLMTSHDWQFTHYWQLDDI